MRLNFPPFLSRWVRHQNQLKLGRPKRHNLVSGNVGFIPARPQKTVEILTKIGSGIELNLKMAFSSSSESSLTPSSSDDEEEHSGSSQPSPPSDLRLDWLDVTQFGLFPYSLAMSSLPGARFRDVRRDLRRDVSALRWHNVTDCLTLLENSELAKFRVQRLFAELSRAGIRCHHLPMADGAVPEDFGRLERALDFLKRLLTAGRIVVVHCYGGLGRTGLVTACFLLSLSPSMTPQEAIERVRTVRGARAIQSVKQYNFVHEFRELRDAHFRREEEDELSR